MITGRNNYKPRYWSDRTSMEDEDDTRPKNSVLVLICAPGKELTENGDSMRLWRLVNLFDSNGGVHGSYILTSKVCGGARSANDKNLAEG